MQNQYPYSLLKRDERGYTILLLRDQQGLAFTTIAKELGLSPSRVAQKYNQMKVKQKNLYIRQIAAEQMCENTSQMKKVFRDAYECYQSTPYVCAYLEKMYPDILREYRAGEPGMPARFIRKLPPFRKHLSQKTIARVVAMREEDKASFAAIGKALHMTSDKARYTYDQFYHRQVIMLLEALQETAATPQEKKAMQDWCFNAYKSSKKRYDALVQGEWARLSHT